MAQNYHSIKATLSTNFTEPYIYSSGPMMPVIFIGSHNISFYIGDFAYSSCLFVYPKNEYLRTQSGFVESPGKRNVVCHPFLPSIYENSMFVNSYDESGFSYDIESNFNKNIELKIYDYGDDNKTGYLKLELTIDGITKNITPTSFAEKIPIPYSSMEGYVKFLPFEIDYIGFGLFGNAFISSNLVGNKYEINNLYSGERGIDWPNKQYGPNYLLYRVVDNIKCSISNFSFESTIYDNFYPIFNNLETLNLIDWSYKKFSFYDYSEEEDWSEVLISSNKIESNHTFSLPTIGLWNEQIHTMYSNVGLLRYDIPKPQRSVIKLSSLNKNGNILLQQADSDLGIKNIEQQSSYNFLLNTPSTENKISNSRSPSLLQQNGKLINIYYDSDTYNIVLINSNDFGVTWGSKMTVTAGIMPSAFIFNNILYLFYGVANGSNMDLKLIKSINGGATWGSPISIISNISKQYITAVSAENSEIKIFYSDSNNNIVDLTSRDIGVTWA